MTTCPHGYTIHSLTGIAPGCHKCEVDRLTAELARMRAALENLSKRDNYYYNGSELIFIDPDTGDYMDVEHYAKKILKGGSQ